MEQKKLVSNGFQVVLFVAHYSCAPHLMAHTHCTGAGTAREQGTGKWVCNPSVPSPVSCPVPGLGVVCTVKGIIYHFIVPGLRTSPGAVVPDALPGVCSFC